MKTALILVQNFKMVQFAAEEDCILTPMVIE